MIELIDKHTDCPPKQIHQSLKKDSKIQTLNVVTFTIASVQSKKPLIKQKNMTCNQKKTQLKNSEKTEMIELAEKDFKKSCNKGYYQGKRKT